MEILTKPLQFLKKIAKSLGRRRYDYAAGFGTTLVKAGESATVSIRPQVAFRPERLVIPKSVGVHFQVDSVKVGDNNQVVSIGSLPAIMFTEDVFGMRLLMDVATPSLSIAVTVTNTSDTEQVFQCGLVGQVVRWRT